MKVANAAKGRRAMDGIAEQVAKFISEEFLDGETNGLGSGVSMIETGIIDSIGLFRLIAFLEESFSIVIEPDDLLAENFETIDAIAGYVRNQLVAKS
jgi:acyl carrier protein